MPCLVCGVPGTPGRCPTHARQHERTRRPASNVRYGQGWPVIRKAILERDHYRCQLRGERCTSRATTVDHVVPVRHGGTNDPSNLLAACSWCNTSKGARAGGGG